VNFPLRPAIHGFEIIEQCHKGNIAAFSSPALSSQRGSGWRCLGT
jgi:hypothetical protein